MLRRLTNTNQFASNTARLRQGRAANLSGNARNAVANSTGARFALRTPNAGLNTGPSVVRTRGTRRRAA